MKLLFFYFLLPPVLSLALQKQELEFDGIVRSYLLHVPKNIQKPSPLVIVLHGAGKYAEEAAKDYGWVEKADKETFIVLFPQAMPAMRDLPENFFTNPTLWNTGSDRTQKTVDDIGFLKRMIEETAKSTSVDRQRCYMTGFSNGASMTYRAGIELSELLAAIAPVSGHLWKKSKPQRMISLLAITGDADPVNPLNGGVWNNPRNRAGLTKPPMLDSVLTWVNFLGLSPMTKTINAEKGIVTTTWGPNPTGQKAIFIVIQGQGHEWPGAPRALPQELTGPTVDSLNATDTIWNFFSNLQNQ